MSWKIVGGPFVQPPVADHERFEYIVERGSVRTGVIVELSGSVMACGPESLPSPLGDAVVTRGRSVIEARASDAHLPRVMRVSSLGVAPVAT